MVNYSVIDKYLTCVNDESLYIEGQDFSTNFATVNIEIEHCVDLKSPEQCPKNAAVEKFWSKAYIFLIVGYKQIDMKNMTHP